MDGVESVKHHIKQIQDERKKHANHLLRILFWRFDAHLFWKKYRKTVFGAPQNLLRRCLGIQNSYWEGTIFLITAKWWNHFLDSEFWKGPKFPPSQNKDTCSPSSDKNVEIIWHALASGRDAWAEQIACCRRVTYLDLFKNIFSQMAFFSPCGKQKKNTSPTKQIPNLKLGVLW